MMLIKGMTTEEMTAMVDAMGWEIIDDEEYDAYDGSVARALTIWQEDHAVAVEVFHGVVDSLEYVPAWAL